MVLTPELLSSLLLVGGVLTEQHGVYFELSYHTIRYIKTNVHNYTNT